MMKTEKEITTMTEINKEEKVNALNHMVELWRGEFDNLPVKPFHFTVNEHDELCLDNLAVCGICDVNTEDLRFDLEVFFIGSVSCGKYYRIDINWPFEQDAYVSSIALVLYSSEES